ncbi:MAG: methionine--tRNA ligase [Candidatus Falkowbacteria bacterium]
MSQKPFYITTTLPYTNSNPHIGFATELIKADVIARLHALQGEEVFFNTGTDEHGLKIYQKAQEASLSVRDYCEPYADKFKSLKELLNLSFTNFIRTTDENHVASAQEFWKRCEANGDIYKKNYQIKYCVGCELEKTEQDLVNGHCQFHPNQELEIIDEENYFFRFSKYGEKLLKFYDANPDFVIPEHRFKEIRNFVAGGLQDFSISRLKSKMPNGVPVPGDDTQVVYVWFDALVNYISTLGWPETEGDYKKFWPGMQVCGKDNLRQQTAMWQAMLMSAGLPNSKQVLIFGFLTVNGQKISKSSGNTVDPVEFANKYGVDTLRYYLLSDILPFEDGDFSEERLRLKFNADLANGLGNLASRVATLLEKNEIETNLKVGGAIWSGDFEKLINAYKFNEALLCLWDQIRNCNEKISAAAPWKMTDREAIKTVLTPIAQDILNVAKYLQIFMPETASKLINQFSEPQIKKSESLFPRLV